MILAFEGDESLRNRAMDQWVEARREYESVMDWANDQPPWSDNEARALEEAAGHWARMLATQTEYFKSLPRFAFAACPWCAAPLVGRFDPFGFDGLAWRGDPAPAVRTTCPHFLLVRLAVSYRDRRPVSPHFEVRPGPEVPYIIPEVLAQSSVQCVVAHIEMRYGYVAYPISYFSSEEQRTRLVSFHNHASSRPQETWDFNLAPWVASRRLRWTKPGSGNYAIDESSDAGCPYLELPGLRRQVVVRGTLVSTLAPPGT